MDVRVRKIRVGGGYAPNNVLKMNKNRLELSQPVVWTHRELFLLDVLLYDSNLCFRVFFYSLDCFLDIFFCGCGFG